MKRKIVITTGTRAEYGILRPILKAVSQSTKLKLFLVVTGTHLSKKHGYTVREIANDGFKNFVTIKMIPKDNSLYSMSKSVGNGIIEFTEIFKKIKPDINIILGDRDEMLSSAIAAYHMNIPNAHIHGGDKTKAGIDEYNRHAITKISNIHFAATTKSAERIIKMGENPKYVFVTGSPSIDEIVTNKITSRKSLESKYGLEFTGNEILLLQHPVTTRSQSARAEIESTLSAIEQFKLPTIAIGPNSDAGSKEIFIALQNFAKKNRFLRFYPTIPRMDYLGFLKNCAVLVGNSSSGIIEGSYFNIPVVNIGIRQKDRERGRNVIDVEGEDSKSIYLAIKKGLSMKDKKFKNDYVYGHGNASKKIIHYLEKIKLTRELIEKQMLY